VLVAFVLVAWSSSLSRIRLQVAFDSVGGTQRFAFPARRCEPIELPMWRFPGCRPLVPACMPSVFTCRPPHLAAARGVDSSVWPGDISSHGKRDCWQGQTGEGGAATQKDRERHVTAQ
jgi:hypothetical protein